eukprot:4886987-Amphidinium_carterae.1
MGHKLGFPWESHSRLPHSVVFSAPPTEFLYAPARGGEDLVQLSKSARPFSARQLTEGGSLATPLTYKRWFLNGDLPLH